MASQFVRSVSNVRNTAPQDISNYPLTYDNPLDLFIDVDSDCYIRRYDDYHCLTDNVKMVNGHLPDPGDGWSVTVPWKDIPEKPFETINEGDFIVEAGELQINHDNLSPTWQNVRNKPFSTIGTGLSVQGDVLVADGQYAEQLSGFLTLFGNSSNPLLIWDATTGNDGTITFPGSGDQGTILATTTSYWQTGRNDAVFPFTSGSLIYAYVDTDTGFISINLSGTTPKDEESFVVGTMNTDNNGKRFIFINGWGTHWHPDDQGGVEIPPTTVFLNTMSADDLKIAMPSTNDCCHVVVDSSIALNMIGYATRLTGTCMRRPNSNFEFDLLGWTDFGMGLTSHPVRFSVNGSASPDFTTFITYILQPIVLTCNNNIDLSKLKNGSYTSSTIIRNLDYVILNITANNKSYFFDGLFTSNNITDRNIIVNMEPNTNASRWYFTAYTTKAIFMGECDPKTQDVTNIIKYSSDIYLELPWESITGKPFEDYSSNLKVDGTTLDTNLTFQTTVKADNGIDIPLQQAFEVLPVEWLDVNNKPFNAVSNTDFNIVENELMVNWNEAPTESPTWGNVTNKPFTAIGTGAEDGLKTYPGGSGEVYLAVDLDKLPKTLSGEILMSPSTITEQSNMSCHTTELVEIGTNGYSAIYPIAQLMCIKMDGELAGIGVPISINTYNVDPMGGTFMIELTYNSDSSMYSRLTGGGEYKLVWHCEVKK